MTENLTMLDIICQNLKNLLHLDAIEVNLCCPNIVGKAQLGYDLQNLETYVIVIFTKFDALEEIHRIAMTFPIDNLELRKIWQTILLLLLIN